MFIIKNDGRFRHDTIQCDTMASAVRWSKKLIGGTFTIVDTDGNEYYAEYFGQRGILKKCEPDV